VLITRAPGQSSAKPWWLAGGMLGLAFGYFFWYTPYAGLTKALSSGLLPGMDKHVGGLVLLPAAAFGTLVGAPLFLAFTGWWRYVGTRRGIRFPSNTMITAGFFMSLVIATTTLNYTFAGVSILFMLLMMRGGVLILSPIVDTIRRRKVRVFSWVALGFSLLAVITALSDVNSYVLTVGAVASLAIYFTGYIGRFRIMSKVAKTGIEEVDRRYFAEEAISAAVWQVVLCGVLALSGLGSVSSALREGFSTFLTTSAVLPAFGVGLLYSALYVYGTLIYLDPREYTWCVPANRCASLLSGLVASFGLSWLTGIAIPGSGQLIATGFIACAIFALSYPAMFGRPVLLFVCGGNTCRSAMAAAIARAMSGRRQVLSAGVQAQIGAPMVAEAVTALRELGISVDHHQAQRLTPALINKATTVYCMTDGQRVAVLAMAPDAAGKIVLLDPAGDIPDPHGQAKSAYLECAERIRQAVDGRLVPA
jgi:protein-tyrosine-phosphatase